MARYRLLEAAVIDNVFHEKGEEVDWDGEPGPHMELIKGEAVEEKEKPPLDPDMMNNPEGKIEPGTSRRK